MKKGNIYQKNSHFIFCSARLAESKNALHNYDMTYILYDKRIMCKIEHGNLFGIEKEIESFSHWYLN